MRFMSMVKSSEKFRHGPPPQSLMEAIRRLDEEATKAGVMASMGGLMPSAMGASIRVAGGKLTVTDGPFSEAKEVVGGFAIFAVNSREEALEWAQRFMRLHIDHWPQWEGEAELRQMFDGTAGCEPCNG